MVEPILLRAHGRVTAARCSATGRSSGTRRSAAGSGSRSRRRSPAATLVVESWSGIALGGLGVAACLAAALSYALYILVAEHAVATRDPISLSCYGFFFASLFWAAFQPWWSFPDGVVGRTTSLHGHLASAHLPVWALVAWLIVLGAIVPFALVVAALRHVSATRAGIASMLEPPAATLVAFLWLGESLGLFQLLGGGLVLSAIALAQTSR